jgi:hypothetical protein
VYEEQQVEQWLQLLPLGVKSVTGEIFNSLSVLLLLNV